MATEEDESWIYETIRYERRFDTLPLPLPPICHDRPHAASATTVGFRSNLAAEQVLIGEDGRMEVSLSWTQATGRWQASTLAADLNRRFRFFPPMHDGAPAKCWFDINLPRG